MLAWLDQSVSRETGERFAIYQALLEKWNARINLVAPSTVADLRQRHFADSAQLWPLRPLTCHRWLDIGSGAGFPGLVIAILSQDTAQPVDVVLVESDVRKAAFLQTVLRETGVKADVIAERIEKLPPQNADVVSARALAPLKQLLVFAAPHLQVGGIGLFPKGAQAEGEVSEALAFWRFSVQKVPSRTDPRGLILKVGDLSHA